jgi:multiple sugar transport system permease protein
MASKTLRAQPLPVEAAPSGLRRQHRIAAILFVLPATVLILSLTIYPLIRTLYLSFNSLEMTVSPVEKFVGVQNYVDVLVNDPRFWNALLNTAYLVIVGVVIQLVLGTGLAVLASEMGKSRTIWLSLFLIPVMIAPVVAGFQFRVIFNDTFGPLNYLIGWFSGGLVKGPLWLADSNWALFSIMLTDVWQWTPFMILIMLAGLQSIPVELTEAAEVDGASYWQIFWQIKIPLLIPIIIIALLIRMMDTFKTFDLVYLLTGGGPGDSTETIAFYTYLNGFKDFSLGYTAAMAFIQLIVITIVARIFLRFQTQQQRGNHHA